MTTCPHCRISLSGVSRCPSCRRVLQPGAAPAVHGDGNQFDEVAPTRPIQNLGTALSTLLGVTGLVLLAWILVEFAAIPALLLSIASAVVTLVWVYRARQNVRGSGRQRLAPGWAIGGWFCPVVNLWFPLQIISDIATVDQQSDKVRTYALIRYAWWVCWLAAWVTAFQYQEIHGVTDGGGTSVSYNFSMNFGGTVASRAFSAVAAFLLALLVRDISVNQQRRVDRHASA